MVEEQEIELIHFLYVVWKRKGLILGGTVLAVAVALGFSLTMPKTYEVSRTLKIGGISGKAIEDRETVMERLKDDRMLTEAIQELGLRMTTPEMGKMVSVDRKSSPHVRFEVRAVDPELATRIADWLAGKIIALHGQIFDEAKVEAMREIRSLETEIKSSKKILDAMIAENDVDAPKAALLQSMIAEKESKVALARRTILGDQTSVIIAADSTPRYPVKPRVKLNAVLAGVLGLFLFIFVAFFLEYVNRIRQQGATRAQGL